MRPRLRLGLLLALLALPLWATLDLNHDGVSDIWSALYPTAGAPEADPDGDGATNQAEALAGTDPAAATSRFVAVPQLDASGNLVLRWSGVVGKRYRIESTTDLHNWTALPDEFTGNDADLTAIVRPVGSTANRLEFWRIAVADADADTDGLNDWEETQLGTNPAEADTDSDGLPDAWEVAHGLNPLVDDSAADPDHDGFTNAQEFAAGMNPTAKPLTGSAGLVALQIFSPR